jgi:uncharacterized membrane protein
MNAIFLQDIASAALWLGQPAFEKLSYIREQKVESCCSCDALELILAILVAYQLTRDAKNTVAAEVYNLS